MSGEEEKKGIGQNGALGLNGTFGQNPVRDSGEERHWSSTILS